MPYKPYKDLGRKLLFHSSLNPYIKALYEGPINESLAGKFLLLRASSGSGSKGSKSAIHPRKKAPGEATVNPDIIGVFSN